MQVVGVNPLIAYKSASVREIYLDAERGNGRRGMSIRKAGVGLAWEREWRTKRQRIGSNDGSSTAIEHWEKHL